jgi:hypothetical protein
MHSELSMRHDGHLVAPGVSPGISFLLGIGKRQPTMAVGGNPIPAAAFQEPLLPCVLTILLTTQGFQDDPVLKRSTCSNRSE